MSDIDFRSRIFQVFNNIARQGMVFSPVRPYNTAHTHALTHEHTIAVGSFPIPQ